MSKAKPDTVRVRNFREGSILLPGLELPSGASEHPIATFKGFSKSVRDELVTFEAEGWLRFGPDPEPEPAPAPANPKAQPEGFQPLPADDALALKAVADETSEAVLAAWFEGAKDRAAVSDAIVEKLTKLGK